MAILEGIEGGISIPLGQHCLPKLHGYRATKDSAGAEHLAGGGRQAMQSLLDPLAHPATKETAAGQFVGRGGRGRKFCLVVLPVVGNIAPKRGLANFVGDHLQHQGVPRIEGANGAEIVWVSSPRVREQPQLLE